MRRLLAWLGRDEQVTLVAFALLASMLAEHFRAVRTLEHDVAQVRGTVPLDDVVSLAELQKMGRQLRAEWELELAARGVPPRSQGTAAGP